MRDPDAIAEKRVAAALLDAIKLLRPLAPLWPREVSWPIIGWNDPDANDPRDVFEATVGFLTAFLDPPARDSLTQHAAVELLGIRASVIRGAVLPALRLGCPPERRGPRRGAKLLRDRWIAAVITTVCKRHELSPYRNPLSEHECGSSIIAKALRRLGIELAESSIEEIYRKHKA